MVLCWQISIGNALERVLFIIIINFKLRAIDGIQRSMKMLEIVLKRGFRMALVSFLYDSKSLFPLDHQKCFECFLFFLSRY